MILHTNDTHGRMRPPVSDALRALAAAHPGAILLDAGDAVSAGNLGVRPGGEPALETMSELGYAAMCLGNRETHPRRELFPLKIRSARFPVLCANIRAKGDAPLPVRPFVTLERGEARVGIFGVTVPMFTRRQWSQPFCDYWFEDPVRVARETAEALRPQVEVLIALTHVGFRADCLLAEACPQVDLVIGGHSHTRLDAPVWVGEVPVVQAYAFGFYAGVARMAVRGGRGRLLDWEVRALRSEAGARGRPPVSRGAPDS